MSGSIADLTRAVSARTGFTTTYVEQRARQLQGAGLLPVANGRQHIAAKPRDLANLLLSLAAAKVRTAPDVVKAYSKLVRLVDETGQAGDAIEKLITDIWAGDRQSRFATILLVEKRQKVVITEAGQKTFYYPPGTIMEFRGTDTVQRNLIVPCCVVAQIGADIGFARCRDAV